MAIYSIEDFRRIITPIAQQHGVANVKRGRFSNSFFENGPVSLCVY